MIKEKNNFNIVLIALFGLDFGVYSLSAFLWAKGYKPYVVEFNHLKIPLEFMVNDYFTNKPISHDLFPRKDLLLLLKLLQTIDPHLIGISVSSVCFRTASWLTKEIKVLFDIPIIWGGVHAIISPEDCIDEVDIVCTGEGEDAIYEVAEKIRKNESIDNVKNTWIRKNGEIKKNSYKDLIVDLDVLPIPDRINGNRKYFIDNGNCIHDPIINAGYVVNAYPMMTSRGCMYSCAFCCNSIIRQTYKGLGSYFRRRSVDHVITELRQVVEKRNIYSVRFWDDVFTYDEEWIDKFCKRYQCEIGKPFVCYGHPKKTTQRILQKLSNVGLTLLYVGIQSGSKKTNKLLFNRQQSNKEIIEFTKQLQLLQITPNFDVIVDNILEEEGDEYETSELLLNLPHPYKVLFFSLCFFPKTPLTNSALAKGYIKEGSLEHKSAKSINNFFLIIEKTKNKRQLFWNCIKAMIVSRQFSTCFIQGCRQNRLFRKYPKVLFLFCRMRMFFCKQLGKIKQTGWLTPAVRQKGSLNEELIWKGNKYLYCKRNRDCSLFLIEQTENRCSLCFRTRVNSDHKLKKIVIEGFQIELMRFKEKNMSHKSVWSVWKRILLSKNLDIMFDVVFPEVYCCHGSEKIRMNSKRLHRTKSSEKELYLFTMIILQRGNVIPFKINKTIRLGTLCRLNERV
jgi:radical SAM superfamily enzyme YgiQ (UPF0313 family)